MFRILYSDTRRILHDKWVRLALAGIVVYQLFYLVTLKFVIGWFFHEKMWADEVGFCFSSIAIFVVTAGTLSTTVTDYETGCLRNKLISGAKRKEVFLSAMIGGMMQGMLYSMTACVSSGLSSLLFTEGFQTYTVQEFADQWLLTTITCMAIGAFSTALVMLTGGKVVSYVIGLSVAFAMKVICMRVLDKLFPSQGTCKLTGLKLTVYRAVDRFVPYSYLSMRPHQAWTDYLVGIGGMIVISVAVGLILFERKELC